MQRNILPRPGPEPHFRPVSALTCAFNLRAALGPLKVAPVAEAYSNAG